MPLWKGPFQEGQALAVFVGVLWVALADWVGVLLWGSRLPLPVWPQHHALPHSQLLQNVCKTVVQVLKICSRALMNSQFSISSCGFVKAGAQGIS